MSWSEMTNAIMKDGNYWKMSQIHSEIMGQGTDVRMGVLRAYLDMMVIHDDLESKIENGIYYYRIKKKIPRWRHQKSNK